MRKIKCFCISWVCLLC